MNNLEKAKEILSEIDEKDIVLIPTKLHHGILCVLIDIAEVLRDQKK